MGLPAPTAAGKSQRAAACCIQRPNDCRHDLGLSCTRDQPPAGLLPPGQGHRAAVFASRQRQFLVRVQGRGEILVARCRRQASRERRRGVILHRRPPSQRSRDIWRFMPRASTNAGSTKSGSNPSKAISTAVGSLRELSGLSRAAPERADGRPQRSRVTRVGADGRQRRTPRSLHRLRHLAIKRSQAMRPGLPVHQAGLSRDRGPRSRAHPRHPAHRRTLLRAVPPHGPCRTAASARGRAMDRHRDPDRRAPAGERCR